MPSVCTDLTLAGHASTLPRGGGGGGGGGGMRVFENGAINGMDLDLQCPPPFNPHGGGGEPPPSFQTATSPMNPYGQCGGGVRGGGAGQVWPLTQFFEVCFF